MTQKYVNRLYRREGRGGGREREREGERGGGRGERVGREREGEGGGGREGGRERGREEGREMEGENGREGEKLLTTVTLHEYANTYSTCLFVLSCTDILNRGNITNQKKINLFP